MLRVVLVHAGRSVSNHAGHSFIVAKGVPQPGHVGTDSPTSRDLDDVKKRLAKFSTQAKKAAT